MDMVKICKKHGELKEGDIKRFISKGYECTACRICAREYDKNRPNTEKRREQNRIRSRTPEAKEKARAREIAYRATRRIKNREFYQRKKNNIEFRERIKKYSDASYQRMKESFSDSYIKKLLRVYKNATPEMIEKKRLQIIEYRKLIKENKIKKEILIKQRAKLLEDRKIRGIVKYCKVHGELTKEYAWFVKNGVKTKNKIYVCITCSKKSNKKSYINNFEKISRRNKIYAENNADKKKMATRNWSLRLADAYVKRYFTRDSNITPEYITAELIDLKRSLMTLKRKLREITNGSEEHARVEG